ncbi:MAG: MAPEG family protein [Myxococcota bacterium]
MTIPFWCVVVVIFIPFILAGIGGAARGKAFGAADNREPRVQAAQLTGGGARIYAAQENAWEAAIMFTAAVLVTHAAGLSAASAAPWTTAFVVFRALHAIFYIQDIDKARSGAFLGGLVCIIALIVKAA